MTYFFEDLEEGQRLSTRSRTVTETDLATFSMLSGDWNPIHSDEEYARTTSYGRRVVHGVFGIALVTGLMDGAGWFAESGAVMLEITGWQFRRPIFVGDTLYCEMEIGSLRPTSSGSAGVVQRTFRLIDHEGNLVQQGECPGLVRRRNA